VTARRCCAAARHPSGARHPSAARHPSGARPRRVFGEIARRAGLWPRDFREHGLGHGGDGQPDGGSASIWVLAAGCLVIACGLLGAALGAATVARHRAGAAADFGALAAARHAIEGQGPACDHAKRIVAENGGQLAACHLDGLDAVVTATAPLAGPFARFGPATATSRAGPSRTPREQDP